MHEKILSVLLAFSTLMYSNYAGDGALKNCANDPSIRPFIGEFHYGEYAFFREDVTGATFSLNLRDLEQHEIDEFFNKSGKEPEDEGRVVRINFWGKLLDKKLRFRRPVVAVCKIRYL